MIARTVGRRRAVDLMPAGGIAALGLCFVILLARDLYVVFPLSTRTGDARLEAWLGPDGANAAYVGVGVLIATAIATTAFLALLPAVRQAWAWGLAGGAASGVIGGIASFVADANARTLSELDLSQAVFLALALVGPLAAGAIGVMSSQTIAGGAIAGFWCGVVGSLVFVVLTLVALQIFATHLESGAWLTEPIPARWTGCAAATGDRLGACRSSDLLGGLANGLLFAPVVSLVLGLAAGAVVLGLRPRPVDRDVPPAALPPPAGLAIPAMLCGLFILILLVEVRANLW